MKVYCIQFNSGNSYLFLIKEQLEDFKKFYIPYQISEKEVDVKVYRRVKQYYQLYQMKSQLYDDWIYDIKQKEIYISDMNELFFVPQSM